eukprot:scaffold55567_cov69-Phaeocystis_antarctica.AAC.2
MPRRVRPSRYVDRRGLAVFFHAIVSPRPARLSGLEWGRGGRSGARPPFTYDPRVIPPCQLRSIVHSITQTTCGRGATV